MKIERNGITNRISLIEMMVLYHLGWKIDYHTIEHTFNKNWFAIPNLTKFTPQTHKSLTIMCKKFNSNTGPDNFEN